MTAIRPSDPADAADDPAVRWAPWFDAARAPAVDAAMRDLFDRLDEQVRRAAPVCNRSGRCCRFDEFGHRLYATALEIAWLLTQVDDKRRRADVDPTGPCPFQVDGACAVYSVRSTGCRVFFCDKSTDEWQHTLYERFLGELRQLHREHDLPYEYVEWRNGLAEAMRSV